MSGVTSTSRPSSTSAASTPSTSTGPGAAGARVLLAAGVPGLVAFVVYCVFSVARHERFGSGSWDMGCHVHNLFLLAYAKPPVSSVLGDANFWGGTNHFMPSLYLAAPLAWTGVTSSLLVLQAALVAAAVLPLAALARRRGLGPLAVAAVSLAYLFAVGTQTFIEFDVHETAPVPLLTFCALLGLETAADAPGSRRARWARVGAYAALVVLAGTKESAIVYAAAVGLWLALFPPGTATWKRRIEGAGIFAGFMAWFFVVTAVIQPALLEPGATMMHVARFKQLGASPADIARSIVEHPLHTVGLLFSPAQKARTLAVTAGGFSFLPLLSPQSLLLAAPTLAARFLSDKREMWGLGFHYSLPLVGCFAFGAVDALARLERRVLSFAARRLSALSPAVLARAFEVAAAVVVVAGCALSNAASPAPPEFSSLQKPYMAKPEEVARYRRALAVIPDAAKVVAQNHFLPHLAFRQFIWQPQRRFVDRADFVILDPRASPWPNDARYVRALVDELRASPAWTVAFEEGTTVVFRRVGA